ncbi:MAG: dihydroneopterin aldolase [Eubacterium sp.]|nr:dihydroneopterin aldolase [Eubacterium sp.]
MDKITIKNLKLFAYHGVNPEEKENGQNFFIDIDYYVNITKACHSDNLDDTVSYAKVVKTVNRAFTQTSYDLIEKAAQIVADAVLDAFEPVTRVDVTVKKPEAPVKADFEYMAVSISRSRN